MRIGIDWGGTKLEIIALDDDGKTLLRERIATPQNDYRASVEAVGELVATAESRTGRRGTVGFGIPGTVSPATGLVKNANSTWLNGKPLEQDLRAMLGREVRIQNDANCFAVSEAVDGAGESARSVAGIIIGTGCGCGIAIDGKALTGRGGIAGEFGHTPLAPMTAEEMPGNECWCGRRACLETYVSGPGFVRTHDAIAGKASGLSVAGILASDTPDARTAGARYVSQLARGIAMLVNIVDPDVIVLGGGMSNISSLYADLPGAVAPHVFTDRFDTPIVRPRHGDSSGVRGAAWLW